MNVSLSVVFKFTGTKNYYLVATQHKLLIGVLDGMRDFDFIVSFLASDARIMIYIQTIYGETRSNRRIFLAQLAKDLFIPIYPRIPNDPDFDSMIKRILYVRTKAIKKHFRPGYKFTQIWPLDHNTV